jgi:hypothetical protein
MPGRRTKLTFVVVAAVGALLVAGCGRAEGHSWQAEFTERLESSTAVIEEASPDLRPSSSEMQVLRASTELGQELEQRRDSVEGLVPPAACEAVQEAGAKKLSGAAETTYNFGKNLTPTLHRRLPRILKEEIAAIGKIEHEAEACG